MAYTLPIFFNRILSTSDDFKGGVCKAIGRKRGWEGFAPLFAFLHKRRRERISIRTHVRGERFNQQPRTTDTNTRQQGQTPNPNKQGGAHGELSSLLWTAVYFYFLSEPRHSCLIFISLSLSDYAKIYFIYSSSVGRLSPFPPLHMLLIRSS